MPSPRELGRPYKKLPPPAVRAWPRVVFRAIRACAATFDIWRRRGGAPQRGTGLLLRLSTDDCLQTITPAATVNLNLTATDKVTIVVGLLKGNDATLGAAVETSAVTATSDGAFQLAASGRSAATNVGVFARGTAYTCTAASGLTAPVKAVVSAWLDIAAPITAIRANRGAITAATTLGTGNLGSWPMFVGRRNNASSPFTGNIYGLLFFNRLLISFDWFKLQRADRLVNCMPIRLAGRGAACVSCERTSSNDSSRLKAYRGCLVLRHPEWLIDLISHP